MKTLIIVRHAKSSWDNANLSDFDRPLNQRGLRDAPFMGNLLKEKSVKPDLILSSPANRAYQTSKFYAEALAYDITKIQLHELIYTSGPKQIIGLINQIDDSVNTIILFGHNPDLSTLTNFLADNDYGSLPTCGTICIDFNVDNWSLIGEETGKVRFFEYPKKYLKKI
ncbi:MAG: histidine phosphatase family protein [Bacteroidota bacterium]|jgi:phosphohistidine phosphatase